MFLRSMGPRPCLYPHFRRIETALLGSREATAAPCRGWQSPVFGTPTNLFRRSGIRGYAADARSAETMGCDRNRVLAHPAESSHPYGTRNWGISPSSLSRDMGKDKDSRPRQSSTVPPALKRPSLKRIFPSPNPLTHSRGELSECVAGVALGQFGMDQVRLFAIVPGRLERIVECRLGFDEVSSAAAIGFQ